jgi:hypothetical protein
MISLETKAALVVVYAPAGFATARLTAVMEDTAATLLRSSGGAVSESRILA